MNEWIQIKYFKEVVMIAVLFSAVCAASWAYLAFKEARNVGRQMNSISVIGKAETFLRPDIATFTFSVVVDEPDAVAAQGKAAQISNDILAYLKSQGVEEKDIKTVNYSLNPKYEYETQVCTAGWCPPGKQILKGYTVDQSMSVKVRKVDTAGDLIGGVGGKGATNISGLSFTVDDTDVAKEKIRAEAIADGKEKARVLAKELGVHLGKLMSYYENTDNLPMPYYGMGGDAMKSEAAMPIMPQVAPGENKLISNVTLVYEIR